MRLAIVGLENNVLCGIDGIHLGVRLLINE